MTWIVAFRSFKSTKSSVRTVKSLASDFGHLRTPSPMSSLGCPSLMPPPPTPSSNQLRPPSHEGPLSRSLTPPTPSVYHDKGDLVDVECWSIFSWRLKESLLSTATVELQNNGGMERIDTLESAELTLGEADNVSRNKSVRFKLIKNGLRMFKQQQQQLDSTELSRIHENGSPQFVQVCT